MKTIHNHKVRSYVHVRLCAALSASAVQSNLNFQITVFCTFLYCGLIKTLLLSSIKSMIYFKDPDS